MAWPRDEWLDAMWECESLTPAQRVVAYAYARFAKKSTVAWCTWPELKRRTGIRSGDTVSKAISGLIEAGWLVEVEKARQHRSARYRLTIPSPSTPESGALATAQTSDFWSQTSDFSAPDLRNPDPNTQTTTQNTRLRAYARDANQHHEDPETQAVISALRRRTGKTIGPDHAASVVLQLVGERGSGSERPGIGSRVAYLAGAIAKDPDPGRFLPTPTAERTTDDRT